jgi:hypothetical protein
MRQVTNAEAYRSIRRAFNTNAGRLRGVHFGPHPDPIPAGTLRAEPAQLLHAALSRSPDDPVNGDWPYYVVSCDGTPIAWLTWHGHVILPAAELTAFQRRHQDLAAQALTSVRAQVLAMLADERDRRESRTDGARPEQPTEPIVRVAAVDEPTRSWWTTISGDHEATVAAVRRLVGADAVRVIDAWAYGWQAHNVDCPRLDMLCALHRAAAPHDIPPGVVGDWFHQLPEELWPVPQDVPARFAAVFRGRFADRQAYVEHVLTEWGWLQALADAGIPQRYLDSKTLTAELMRDVNVIDLDHKAGIVVVRRAPAG